jgi:hypothetical protein
MRVQDRREAKEDERRKKSARKGRGAQAMDVNPVNAGVDLREMALAYLNEIKSKFRGKSSTITITNNLENGDKLLSTSNMVEALIRESTDMVNLVGFSSIVRLAKY